MKGIQSKHLRKKLRDRRLKLSSAGSYNQNFDLTIRLTNIKPKWSYGLKYAKGNIYMMDRWEEMVVNIAVSGSMVHQAYTNVDGNETTTKSYEAITDWHERNSEWCNRQTRRQVRSWINDGEYCGRYQNDNSCNWGGGIGIKKLLQLFGIPNDNIRIGTIRFEDTLKDSKKY